MSRVAQVHRLRSGTGAVLLAVLLFTGLTPAPAAAAPAAPPPVISSFTPAIAAPGDSVTVTATNIDPEPALLTVLVNGVSATVTARTATTATFVVPYETGGGKITVTTPGGTGVSSGDLFIPPAGVVDDIAPATGRLTVGSRTTLSVPAGKTLLRLFDADAGDRFAVQADTATPGGCSFELRIYGPKLTRLGSSSCTTAGNWLDPSLISEVAGPRTLSIKNTSAAAGSLAVTITKIVDTNLGVLALDGTSRTINFATPGQNAYFTFTGTAGQRVTVQTTAASTVFGCCYLGWGVYGPDNKRVGSIKFSNDVLDPPVTLPTAGAYQLRLDPHEARIGSITVTARTVIADTDFGVLPLDGTAKTATLSVANQNGYFTFTATANQRVAVRTTAASAGFGCCYINWGIYNAAGKRVGAGKAGNAYLEAVTLPAGAYRLRLDPAGARTGSITVSAWDVAANADLGVLPLDGTARIAALTSAGRNGFYTFTGTAGQRLMLQTSKASTTFGCCYLKWAVYGPTGARVGALKSGNAQTGPVALPAPGTYQLRLDPAGTRTGSITVQAWNVPVDVDLGALALTNTAKTVSIASPGQNGYLTFTGAVGQTVTVTASRASTSLQGSFLAWSLRRPDGTSLPKAAKQGNGTMTVTLDAAGVHRVYVDPAGIRTGSVTFTAR